MKTEKGFYRDNVKLTDKQVRIARDIFNDYMAHCEAACTCGSERSEYSHFADCEYALWVDEKWNEAKEIAVGETL